MPVLDLADPPEAALDQASGMRPVKRQKAAAKPQAGRQTLRLPWQRRPKRQTDMSPTPVAAVG
ncbi:MAG: hypothetical protein K0S35_3921 [Geminicoccaceae bacterium]|nr:hypothetical protein [Geminicoccaceae bacterium]